MKRLCINYFGGPSSGKTVAAASLFTRLKKLHVDCELVAEFPKDLVLEGNTVALANQIYVMANQLYRIQCAYNSTVVAIVDSPILLSTIYNPHTSQHLIDLVFEQHTKFNNLNVVVQRDGDHPHSMLGRVHSLTESVTLDNQIIQMLEDREIPYLDMGQWTEDLIIDFILGVLEE
jgi:hypothetical protein